MNETSSENLQIAKTGIVIFVYLRYNKYSLKKMGILVELDWITPEQVAEKWGVTARQVQSLCSQDKINNADADIARQMRQ
jgi:hypothetical protein